MENLKNIAYVSIIVLTILVFGCIVWISASYFFSLNVQVTRNTNDIQSIVNYINQKTQVAPVSVPSAK